MKIRILILLITLAPVFFGVMHSFGQSMLKGINLTGAEKVWETPSLSSRLFIQKLEEVKASGYNAVRIPLALSYLLNDPRTKPELNRIIKAARKLDMHLVLANFGHELSESSSEPKFEMLIENWEEVLKLVPKNPGKLYIEVANEPDLNPNTWYSAVELLVPRLQVIREDIPLIIGAINFNSMFELSRMEPWNFENLIYTFHFYEPFLFTHQGTPWTGSQNSTVGIPFPFDPGAMPALDPEAKGTPGEVNYRDYEKTGNQTALEDKLGQIACWAEINGVRLWCTEYGVTQNADTESRENYLRATKKILEEHGIPGFVWEWEGNFGVKDLIEKSPKE